MAPTLLQELPTLLEHAELGAWIEYGKRQLTWTVKEQGEWFRNKFEMAWIDVNEQAPFRGEPLSLIAQRRTVGDLGRVGFTANARAQLAKLVLPAVARAGFDRLWNEQRARQVQPARSYNAAEEAAALVRWWRAREDLERMQADGMVEFRPIEHDHNHRRPTTLMPSPGTIQHLIRQDVIAEAWTRGEHVGWMTSGGDLVPDGESLR